MSKCDLCGEDMPAGETMFKFHGYSGPCPKPALKQIDSALDLRNRIDTNPHLHFAKLAWHTGIQTIVNELRETGQPELTFEQVSNAMLVREYSPPDNIVQGACQAGGFGDAIGGAGAAVASTGIADGQASVGE